MGYIRDHAIVVVGTYDDHLEKAHGVARRIFGEQVTPITPPATNGSQAFMVPPDGSKEGWSESDEGDARREEFVAYLRSTAYEDGSSALKWVEVVVSDDNDKLAIERDYRQRRRSRAHA